MVRGLEDLASYLFEFTKKVATRCTEHVVFKSSPGHHKKRLASCQFFLMVRGLEADARQIPRRMPKEYARIGY